MSWSKKVVIDVMGPDQAEFANHVLKHVNTTKTAFNVDVDADWHDHDDSEECSTCYELYDNERRS